MRYRNLAATLAIALVAGACGSPAASTSPSAAAPTPSSASPSGDSSASPSASPAVVESRTTLPISPGEVIVWIPAAVANQDSNDEIFAAFRELYPEITVKPEYFPEDGFNDKLTSAMVAGTGPDVWLYFDQANEYFATGVAEPLDAYIEVDSIDPNMWFQPMVGLNLTHDGKYYAVPRDIGATMLQINTKLFSDAGVAVPTGEWTFDDFTAATKNLANTSGKIFGTDFGVDAFSLVWGPMAWNWGAGVLSDDGRKTVGFMDSDATKSFTQWLLGLQADGAAMPADQVDALAGPSTPFNNGHVATTVGSLWNIGQLREDLSTVGGVSFPAVAGQPAYAWASSVGYAMNATSKHKNEAWALLKFLSGNTAGKVAAEHLDWAPPQVAVWEETGLDKDPLLASGFNTLQLPGKVPEFARTRYFWDCVFPPLSEAYDRAARTKEDVSPLLDAAAVTAQECLDKDYAS